MKRKTRAASDASSASTQPRNRHVQIRWLQALLRIESSWGAKWVTKLRSSLHIRKAHNDKEGELAEKWPEQILEMLATIAGQVALKEAEKLLVKFSNERMMRERRYLEVDRCAMTEQDLKRVFVERGLLFKGKEYKLEVEAVTDYGSGSEGGSGDGDGEDVVAALDYGRGSESESRDQGGSMDVHAVSHAPTAPLMKRAEEKLAHRPKTVKLEGSIIDEYWGANWRTSIDVAIRPTEWSKRLLNAMIPLAQERPVEDANRLLIATSVERHGRQQTLQTGDVFAVTNVIFGRTAPARAPAQNHEAARWRSRRDIALRSFNASVWPEGRRSSRLAARNDISERPAPTQAREDEVAMRPSRR